jgi:hypothetical protein
MSLEGILAYLEGITKVASTVPIPQVAIISGIALEIEQIVGAAIRAHAASSGKTVDEIVAGLKHVQPVA